MRIRNLLKKAAEKVKAESPAVTDEAETTDHPAAADPADVISSVAEEDNAEAEEAVDWQARYNSEHEAFERYRREIGSADERRRKEEAYSSLLSECGIPEKFRPKLIRMSSSIELDEDGKILGADSIKAEIRRDWSELIPNSGVPVISPAIRRGQVMTKESIMAIKDRDERRAAIRDNMDLFGG